MWHLHIWGFFSILLHFSRNLATLYPIYAFLHTMNIHFIFNVIIIFNVILLLYSMLSMCLIPAVASSLLQLKQDIRFCLSGLVFQSTFCQEFQLLINNPAFSMS